MSAGLGAQEQHGVEEGRPVVVVLVATKDGKSRHVMIDLR